MRAGLMHTAAHEGGGVGELGEVSRVGGGGGRDVGLVGHGGCGGGHGVPHVVSLTPQKAAQLLASKGREARVPAAHGRGHGLPGAPPSLPRHRTGCRVHGGRHGSRHGGHGGDGVGHGGHWRGHECVGVIAAE